MNEYANSDAAEFRAILESFKSRPVAVLGHLRPDGDCIGSQVALTRVMRKMGLAAVAVNGHAVPRALQGFVGDTPFFEGADFNVDGHIAVAVDCADFGRIGSDLNARFATVAVNIDHHISNARYGERNFIDPESAATAEILARLFLDAELPIDAVTAQALYAGIATDTGQFRFNSTTKDVFELCARLITLGADPAAAAVDLYERESPAKLALLQRFIQSFRFYCDRRVCVGVLGRKDWEETGAAREDTEGLVDYARCLDGVEIGILLEERESGMKGSLRAKNPVHRVDLLARQFNGGGHACAAGFDPDSDLDAFYPRLVKALEAHFHDCDHSNL